MKNFIFLLILATIFSCSKKIDKKDLLGVWYYDFKENDNNNLSHIIIKNDSVTLIDYLYVVKKGPYVIKNDTITINLKNEILRKKINITDTSIILNSTSFIGPYEDDNIKHKEYNLVSFNSERKLTAEELSEYQGSFFLLKENDSIKIKRWNKFVSFEEYIDSTPIHFEKIGHIALLGENFTLNDIKTVFFEMYYYNFGGICLVTKTNFHNYKYDVYYIRTDVWQIEVDKYLKNNKKEKREMVIFPEAFSREKFISLNNPFLLKIKSKNDFTKLEKRDCKLNSV